jgi:hypothetical protein
MTSTYHCECELQKILDAQPFYVVTDASYDRMMDKLLLTETPSHGRVNMAVKTYLGVCPHKTKEDCNCSFNLNFLKDGKIVRVNKGIIKPVIKESEAWEEVKKL